MPHDSEQTRDCPIAIIGMDCLFPDAAGLHEYWRLIRHGEDAITDVPPTHWRISDYYHPQPGSADLVNCKRGSFLSPTLFDPLEWGIPPALVEATDTAQLLGLVVAKRALADAGYDDRRQFDRRRVGVILGVTGTQELTLPLTARLGHPLWRRALQNAGIAPDVAEKVVREIAAGYVRWHESSFPGLLGNVVAGRIANRLDLRGTNCVVDAACASSLGAVHLAALELACGRADVVLTGGVDTLNDIFMFMCFSKAQALSPTGDARPFDADADGTVIGEGLGMLVLKRLADAERDGDRIYAVLRGIGSSSDGRSQSIYAPHAVGQARALRNAYERSGIGPETIELVEAHGTGTRVGDMVEVEALKTVFREARPTGRWCALGSVKSQIGHTKAAAGAASLIKAVLALYHRVLPATIKISTPNPRLDLEHSPFYLSIATRPWFRDSSHPRRAAVSSFGFGGSNFHAVLEEYPATPRVVAWDGSVQIIALSAQSPTHLERLLNDWQKAVETGLSAAELAARARQSRQRFSAREGCRMALVVERGADLSRLLRLAADALRQRRGQPAWQLPDVCFAGPEPPGKLALLFPGQGSQYLCMGRDLVCHFPPAFDAVAAADADRPGLAELIYPQPTFDARQRQAQEDELRRTEHTQPALGAVSLAALRVLRHFGVEPDFLAGHSFGELVALHAAGRIDEAALRRLARLRGQLMAEAGGDEGCMLAVEAPLDELDALLARHGDDVVLANRNTPTQGVVSGRRPVVRRVAELCAARGWRTSWLAVSAAFHSRFMAPARERFRLALREVAFEPGRIPVFANVTAAPYPERPDDARELLARQLTSPVDFLGLVRNLYRREVRTFVEVGPRSVLTGLVRNILNAQHAAAGTRSVHAVALDAASGHANGIVDLARVLALLAVLGHPVDLRRWERPAALPPRSRMAIPLLGVNYRSPTSKSEGAEAPVTAPSQMTQEASMPDAQHPAQNPGWAAPPTRHAATGDPSPSARQTAQPSDPPTSDPGALSLRQALQALQESLRAMQTLQEQTAAAHERFLQTQQRAHESLQALVEGQQRLIERALGLPPHPDVTPDTEVRRHGERRAGEEVACRPTPAPSTVPSRPGGPPAAAQAGPRPEHAEVEAALLRIVSEQTGCPPDSIRLEMDLEEDLAIDPVRQVEIIDALREQFPALNARLSAGGPLPRTLQELLQLVLRGGFEVSAPQPADLPPGGAIAAQAAQEQAGNDEQRRADDQDVAQVVLQVVSGLTGYPTEMLDLEMDMEADLGIDSIKRLEILGAVQRQIPQMEPVSSQHTGSLRTLRDIIAYAQGALAQVAPAEAVTPADAPDAEVRRDSAKPQDAPQAPANPVNEPQLERRVLTAVDLPPVASGPLPIAAGHEVCVMDDGTPLAGLLVERFKALGHAARVVGPRTAGRRARQRKVAGLILLAPPTHGGPDPCSWDEDAEAWAGLAFECARAVGASLRQAAENGGALLATVARLDGAFGLREPIGNPLSGVLAGLAKTLAHEWPTVRCRALDVSADWEDVRSAADEIVRELSAAGPLEVGLAAGRRVGLEAVDRPAERGPLPLEDGDVVVVSGGGRGVTADVCLELARLRRLTLVLLGRSPEPTPEPAWLAGREDESEIKRALLAELSRAGKRPTPRQLEAAYLRHMANREIARNIERLRATGATVVYRSVDVRDAATVGAVLGRVRDEHGPVRGVIHAAGVIADRRIEDKTPEQFAAVFDTKVRGLGALLAATREDELRFLVLFSSVSARFGRAGQVDYAMANEALNKVARHEAARRSNCRVVAINWGPWDGGMVGPALGQEFARLGVGLIPRAAGARALVAELCAADGQAEVLIGKGLSAARLAAPATVAEAPRARCLTPAADSDGRLALAFERRLDLERHPFLGSHVIGGRAVLPLALMLEWLAHGALHDNPGLVFCGIDGLRVFKGVMLEREPKTIRVLATRARPTDGGFEVAVELRSAGDASGELLHARGRALLAAEPPAAQSFERPQIPAQSDALPDPETIYRDILFHGPHFQAIERLEALGPGGIAARVRTAPPPEQWMRDPLRSAWLTDPLVIDAALQLGSLWCHQQLGAVSLPGYGASYRQYRPFAGEAVDAVLLVRETGPQRLAADVSLSDAAGLVARLEGFEWTADPSLRSAFDRNVLATA